MTFLIIGNKNFDTNGNTYVMGILNVTPDSFSDGGKFCDETAILKHTEEMLADGADIIDIGGESTRPGAAFVSVEEELSRVIPAIKTIKKHFDVPVSLDTYKPEVAEQGIEAGADLINDIWGLRYDEKMADIIAKYDVACCLMHNEKERIKDEDDTFEAVMGGLRKTLEIAKKAGIKPEKIMLDPGVGFAKDADQNLSVIKKVKDFEKLGYPILLGTSRKSVIGKVLGTETDDRLGGTVSTTVYAAMYGISFVRVHDVRVNAQAIKMTRAILQAK